MPETSASNPGGDRLPAPKPPKPPKAPKPPKPPKPLNEAGSDELLPGYETVDLRDAESMKALAHPARMAVFDFLGTRRIQGFDGATATEIAEVAGMTPSAMSYHLRTLAKAGFIEEAPGRGDARERVWRLKLASFSIRAEEDASESDKVVERAMVETFSQQHQRNFRRWLELRQQVAPELREAATVDSGRLRLTLSEADEFQRRYRELESEFARVSLERAEKGVDPSDGSVVFHVRLELFPEV